MKRFRGPSLTAIAVAAGRAIGHAARPPGQPDIDAAAAGLLPLPQRLRALIGGDAAGSRWALDLARRSTLGLVDHLGQRTRLIDQTIEEAVARGAQQLLVLGAGLDSRALRMACLAEVAVFEVDHPATQRYKRHRLAALPRLARSLELVGVDFERQDLGNALDGSGWDARLPACVVWEGVTMYLPERATMATLRALAARLVAESTLILTWSPPTFLPNAPLLQPAVRRAFAGFGEPLVGLTSQQQLENMLQSSGFEANWSRRPQSSAGQAPSLRGWFWPDERVACARRMSLRHAG